LTEPSFSFSLTGALAKADVANRSAKRAVKIRFKCFELDATVGWN
jgi:hypothetical protein